MQWQLSFADPLNFGAGYFAPVKTCYIQARQTKWGVIMIPRYAEGKLGWFIDYKTDEDEDVDENEDIIFFPGP